MAKFRIRPRYTPGQDGIVDQRTAERVAARERNAYTHWRSGGAGSERQAEAEAAGLAGIVEIVPDDPDVEPEDMLITARM